MRRKLTTVEAFHERLDARIDGYAFQSRARDEMLERRIAALEQATLELAEALRRSGVESEAMGSLPSPLGLAPDLPSA